MEGRIDMQGTHAGVEEQRRVATGARSRRLPATLLVAAFVGFLLPFATVSCGTPVTFTGIELATANVPSEGIDDTEFAGEVESNGTTVAAFALGLVVLALALLLARIPGWSLARSRGPASPCFSFRGSRRPRWPTSSSTRATCCPRARSPASRAFAASTQ